MKKLLSIFAAFGLTATTSATVVACGDNKTNKGDKDSFSKLNIPSEDKLVIEKPEITEALVILRQANSDNNLIINVIDAKDEIEPNGNSITYLFISHIETNNLKNNGPIDYMIKIEQFGIEKEGGKSVWTESSIASKNILFKSKTDGKKIDIATIIKGEDLNLGTFDKDYQLEKKLTNVLIEKLPDSSDQDMEIVYDKEKETITITMTELSKTFTGTVTFTYKMNK